MPDLTIHGLSKTFEGNPVLRELSLTVRDGEFFTLLGPSGCGKSTTLHCVAGLEKPSAGRIVVGERVFVDSDRGTFLAPEERNLGMVFQSYALWPHMTIAGNLAFPLALRKVPRARQRQHIHAALEKVGLAGLARRYPHQLSGGQQQRVALARALVYSPALLLLDEPLSNLDARLRDDLRAELQRLQAETDVTMVYVTHDQTEALSLSSRIAVMNQGRVEQIGTPTEIYNFPATEFVATFVGHINLIAGEVGSVAGDHIRVRTPIGTVESAGHGGIRFGVGDAVTVCIRPENIGLEVVAPGSEPVGEFRGRVMSRSYLGELGECQVRCGSETVTVRSHPRLIPEPGTDVAIKLNPERSHVIAVEQGDRRR